MKGYTLRNCLFLFKHIPIGIVIWCWYISLPNTFCEKKAKKKTTAK